MNSKLTFHEKYAKNGVQKFRSISKTVFGHLLLTKVS